MTLYIITVFVALCAGIAISVYTFGTGGKRKRIFQDIYFSVEETDGIGIMYTKTGEYSAVLKIENPVQKFSADTDSYYEFTRLFTALAQTLGKAMRCTNRIFSSESSLRTRRTGRTNFFHRPISAISRDAATRTAFAT